MISLSEFRVKLLVPFEIIPTVAFLYEFTGFGERTRYPFTDIPGGEIHIAQHISIRAQMG